MNPLLASFFALASSVLFAVFSVMARRNMRHTSAFTGSLITLSIGTVVLVVISAFLSSWRELTLPVALWFLAGGALAPGLAQALMFLSIGYIGVGRAMPLITVTPFFSTLVAMAWLGERPGVVVLAATFFVVAGCVLLALKREGEKPWRRIFILMPMAHAVSFAFAASIRKHTLALMPEPLLGATLSYAISLPVLFVFYPFLPENERLSFNRAGVMGFALAGSILTLSFFCHFTSYRYGDVSIIAPIVYTAPLFSLLLARIWLKGEEEITWQKTVGAVLLFIGMVVIIWQAA